ncbi:hypothetical protein [Arthrobacter sp. efr-133-R2A-63]|uniref:hypothetical protein n=1 Tax=Arthrobacter sp. efr-133-R2A-63 TaxID=3040278 RepID=UPI00254E955F|nr:hypothetical protein [Arthrobacter sp. efr-133-R2A-63]
MGNLPWIFVLLVPSLGFFLFLIVANIRLIRRRKALGLPPLGVAPRRFLKRRRRKIRYVVIEEHTHDDANGNPT